MENRVIHKEEASVAIIEENGMRKAVLQIEPGDISAVIEIDRGGTVSSLKLSPDGSHVSAISILYEDTKKELDENPWFRGRILFPFNDRIKDGKYSWEGSEYQLERNDSETGDAIHGFLFREKMDVLYYRTDESFACIALNRTLPAEEGYPFSPEIAIEYKLAMSSFEINLTVFNKSQRGHSL
jgi:aldose 1-epimerase